MVPSVTPGCPIWYATHRPSGENIALVGSVEAFTSPNRVAFRSLSENIQSDEMDPFVALNSRTSPSGDHDSGVCDVPGSGVVRRSAVPPIGRLPEYGGIALSIGLKRHAAAVGGPDREAVVPFEREPPHRARTGQLVD